MTQNKKKIFNEQKNLVDIFQRRHVDDQQAHKMVLNIANYQRNAYKNHN